ncbi:MAG: OmpA family protein [bacterium]
MRSRITVFLFILFTVSLSFAQPNLVRVPNDDNYHEYVEYAEKEAPSEDAFVAVQRLAYHPIKKGDWSSAIDIFKKYKPKFPAMQNRFDKIIEILEAPIEHLTLKNLGSGVNTSRDEFSPVISADGMKLYFTRDNPDENEKSDEDVMLSEYHDGSWTDAIYIGKNVDTRSSESVNGISADGSRIFLFGNYDGSFGSGDIFYSDKDADGKWDVVKHLPKPVNTEDFESDGFMTSDGKAIIFTSDRKGGVGEYHEKGVLFHGDNAGNTDIYISFKNGDEWGEPINLGPTVNTPYSERKPYLHPDGKTLYFVSDGHAGLGMTDIYKSVRLKEDSWTEWSEPVNLGKEINNGADNFGYRVSTDGMTAYLSLDNRPDGNGQGDIYSMSLTAAAKPAPVAVITGKVTDENGNKLDAAIKWDDLSSLRNVGELKSDPQTGDYFITLPLGKNYGYYAEKQGYYPVSKSVDLSGKTEAVHLTENITLVSIKSMREKETAVRLNNIFFEYDKAELKTESYAELKRLAEILKKNPDARTEIGGHTDDKGSDAYNLELSKKRTQSVVAYLVSIGCNKDMLAAKGYGKALPVASNDTDEGRALNRRVEFKFIR